jgi:hypothetical protein
MTLYTQHMKHERNYAHAAAIARRAAYEQAAAARQAVAVGKRPMDARKQVTIFRFLWLFLVFDISFQFLVPLRMSDFCFGT